MKIEEKINKFNFYETGIYPKQYFFSSEKGKISCIKRDFKDVLRVWDNYKVWYEVYCVEGNLFEDTEQFKTFYEAQQFSLNLLDKPKKLKLTYKVAADNLTFNYLNISGIWEVTETEKSISFKLIESGFKNFQPQIDKFTCRRKQE